MNEYGYNGKADVPLAVHEVIQRYSAEEWRAFAVAAQPIVVSANGYSVYVLPFSKDAE